MAWYWPKIDDADTAREAVKGGVAACIFISAFTGLMAILSLIYRKPIFGIDGLGLVNAALFAFVGWRIHRMSRTFAVIGLVLHLAEVGDRVLNGRNGAVGVLTLLFILGFVGAIRGTFAFYSYRKQENQPQAIG